ncbi:unnamed protein product [Linum trigynum]|uniref:Myb-like domain-containing protein n=1 Tax=Linum trigynum TaxID=586398 RepID=A0AAV2CWU1_9ROSI
MMADQGGGGGGSVMIRDYRKGNWTVTETMVLIEAKRMDEERRTKRIGASGNSKPAELRWKWVEDYCWRKGCFRSQNQCNDKWDNLMRDYKKVRDYHRRLPPPFPPSAAAEEAAAAASTTTSASSYWKLDKNERKERNLPSNMLPQIYDALVDVVESRGGGGGSHPTSGANTPRTPSVSPSSGKPMIDQSTNDLLHNHPLHQQQQQPPPAIALPPPLLTAPPRQHPISVLPRAQPAVPPPPPPHPLTALPLPPHSHPPPPPTHPPHQPSPTTSDDGSSEEEDSLGSPPPAPNKRMRTTSLSGCGGGGEEGTSRGGGGTTATSSPSTSSADEGDRVVVVGREISRVAEAIQACQEGQERRHREMVSLQERRLEIEESNTEITRHGINGLVGAVNKLANSILALASSSSSSPSHMNNNSTGNISNKPHNPNQNPSSSSQPPN